MTLMLRSLLILIGFLNGCSWNSHKAENHFEVKQDHQVSPEIYIPSILWDLLEEKKIINSNGKLETNVSDTRRFEENVFVGVKVHLREKTPGVLGGKNLEFISTQNGGLHIDLAHYIKEKKGTFLFSFESTSELDPVSAQVLFLSDSIIKNTDQNQTVGGGCGKFYDITKSYLSKMRDPGLEVNITDGRHVSLLAGTFLMRVSHLVGVRMLTQVTITDSNFPELLCDRSNNIEK